MREISAALYFCCHGSVVAHDSEALNTGLKSNLMS